MRNCRKYPFLFPLHRTWILLRKMLTISWQRWIKNMVGLVSRNDHPNNNPDDMALGGTISDDRKIFCHLTWLIDKLQLYLFITENIFPMVTVKKMSLFVFLWSVNHFSNGDCNKTVIIYFFLLIVNHFSNSNCNKTVLFVLLLIVMSQQLFCSWF